MALTDTALKALRPKDRVYTVADERGLYVEVATTGGVSWRYRYRLDGKQEKLTLGKYPALTLKNARLLRDQAAQEVAVGRSPADQKQAKKVLVSTSANVAQFGERYLREVVAKHRKSDKFPRRYLEKCVLPAIGTKLVADVTVEDVRAIIWKKKLEGFDAAAGQLRGLMKRMFDYAMTCGVSATNPVLALPMRHVHLAQSRDRTLSQVEIRTFLNAVAESNIRRQFKVALRLILLTMVRKSELLLARWDQIDLERGEWSIPAENSKTGKPHIVYLSRQAAALFKELVPLASGSELVLPGRGTLTKPFAHNAINTALKVALKGEPIPAFTIHDLRRTASTLLHEKGWPSDVVEKALNHNLGGVRGIYNRAEYEVQRREMLQFWADFIDQTLSPSKSSLDRAAVAIQE